MTHTNKQHATDRPTSRDASHLKIKPDLESWKSYFSIEQPITNALLQLLFVCILRMCCCNFI